MDVLQPGEDHSGWVVERGGGAWWGGECAEGSALPYEGEKGHGVLVIDGDIATARGDRDDGGRWSRWRRQRCSGDLGTRDLWGVSRLEVADQSRRGCSLCSCECFGRLRPLGRWLLCIRRYLRKC